MPTKVMCLLMSSCVFSSTSTSYTCRQTANALRRCTHARTRATEDCVCRVPWPCGGGGRRTARIWLAVCKCGR
eukprot:3765286-Prymnesium_polylepis.1